MKERNGKIKRPKFIFSYLVSAVILLIIFAFLGLFILMPELNEYMEEIEEADHFICAHIDNEVYEESFEGPVSVRIKAILINHYLATGQRYRYQNDDTGMIAPCESALIFYRRTLADDNVEVLELADKKYLEYFKTEEAEAFKINDSDSNIFTDIPYLYFMCTEFYADVEHGKFIPVEIELFNSNYDLSGVKLRFNPDNTEGFTHIICDINDPEKSSSAVGIAGGYEGEDLDEDYRMREISDVPPHAKCYSTELEPVPFVKVYKDQLIRGILIIAACALVFAFVPAIISYNIKLRRYQIFEYRRKVTDAMAHDLKTPMAAITAYAENLSNHIGTDKQEHYAGKIMETVSEMNGMVNSILEFSRSEDTGVKIKKEETDISQIIEKIISDNEVTINTRFLTVNYDRKSVTLKTDPELFKQALANLIGNAVIHCEEGSAVDISCGKDRITIVNTACEKIEDAGKLKQAFVKGSSSRGNRGSGLGLAIADNDLALLGYKLELRTEADKFIAEVKL